MALNSFITEEGLEMGRAQVMQAEPQESSQCLHEPDPSETYQRRGLPGDRKWGSPGKYAGERVFRLQKTADSEGAGGLRPPGSRV